MTPRRKSVFFVSLAAAVAAGAFAFTYWVFSQQAARYLRSPGVERSLTGSSPQTSRPEPLPSTHPPELRTTSETMVVRRVYYSECGNEVVERHLAGKALAGKTAEELARLEGQGTVESFNAREAVVLVTVNGACPKHATQRYLGIADGHVAVFKGRPDRPQAEVVEVFDLETGALPEREVQDLRRGVPVNSDDELKRVLQSYLELAGF